MIIHSFNSFSMLSQPANKCIEIIFSVTDLCLENYGAFSIISQSTNKCIKIKFCVTYLCLEDSWSFEVVEFGEHVDVDGLLVLELILQRREGAERARLRPAQLVYHHHWALGVPLVPALDRVDQLKRRGQRRTALRPIGRRD